MLDREKELERIAAERLTTEREADRDAWRATLACVAGCVGSCLLGLVMLGFAFHTEDQQLGWVFFWAGLVIGYSGMVYSLSVFYRRGEARGDW